MSNRRMDTRGEKALGLFLDKFFYPQLLALRGLLKSERIYDTKKQKEGIDLLIYVDSGNVLKIDEKAHLHYINAPKPTFAFEVSYLLDKDKRVMDGWLINTSNQTDYYNLIWINEARTDCLNRIVAEDFLKVTALLIGKEKVVQYLSDNGYTLEKIKILAQKMRNNKEKIIRLTADSVMYFSNEGPYEEKPINVLINEEVLRKYAAGVYIVTRDTITSAK